MKVAMPVAPRCQGFRSALPRTSAAAKSNDFGIISLDFSEKENVLWMWQQGFFGNGSQVSKASYLSTVSFVAD